MGDTYALNTTFISVSNKMFNFGKNFLGNKKARTGRGRPGAERLYYEADAGSDDGLYKLKNLEGMFTEAGNTKKKKT